MLYPHWRPSPDPKSVKFKPKPRQHSGASPDTRVLIRTNSKEPYVIWESSVPGVTKGKYLNQAVRRALRDGTADMLEYVNRKINKISM
jgi:hypothetical protein